MLRANIGQAILAGFVATLVMTFLMYLAPLMGMPKMDIASMLGSLFFTPAPAPGTSGWWVGMIMHFINGSIIFPLVFAYLLYPLLPGRPWVKGLGWGLVLWFLAQALVMPMMGMGFFTSEHPQATAAVVGSLLAHILYGAIFGALYGRGGAAVTHVDYERPAA